ncbi:hypothetical protein BDV93DRAFT_611960 [Ceratobasidium sp. AG-I]|nr:hypothetical protein BDV93DRAFT_611960 [Ceratobasidium sp. AG-I]
MHRTLPTELLALVASNSVPSSQAALARTCRRAYTVAVRPLYAYIDTMDTARTTRCLETLANNEHLARLVLVTRAFEKMDNLVDLSVQLGGHAASAVLARAKFKLTDLVCVLASDRAYPLARFLESQPGIESLHIACGEDGLDTLAPDALPALRNVAAPFTPHSSPYNYASGPSHAHIHPQRVYKPSTSVELALGLDLFSPAMTPIYLETALSHLGDCAPWVGLLRLEARHGYLSRSILCYSITRALAHFPNLHTLVIMAPIPPHAYIHPEPQFVPPPISSISLPPYPLSMHPNLTAPPEPDLLYNTTHHLEYLRDWHAVYPGLQRVVFPIGVYTYVRNEDEARYWYGKGGCVVNFGHRVQDDVRSGGKGASGQRAGTGSGVGASFIRQPCVCFMSV